MRFISSWDLGNLDGNRLFIASVWAGKLFDCFNRNRVAHPCSKMIRLSIAKKCAGKLNRDDAMTRLLACKPHAHSDVTTRGDDEAMRACMRVTL